MDAQRWYELGNEELAHRNFQDAKELLTNAIQQDPDFIDAHDALAQVHIHQGNFDLALAEFRLLMDLAPSLDYRVKEAGLLLFLDEAKQAEERFASIVEDFPQHQDALKGLGDSYFRQMKFDQAHEIYDKLLEIYPENGFLWFSKAEAYYRAQDHEKSYAAIEQAIELEHAPEFFAFKGDFFIRHDNYERALEQYTLAANLTPRNAEIQMRLGFIFRILNRQRDAIDAFDKALEIDPYLGEAMENKIEILQSMGKQESALATMEQLIRLHPEDLKSGLELAHYYMDNKGYQRAAEIFEVLIEVHFKNSDVWYGLAYSLHEIEEYDRARQAIVKAIEFDEDTEEYNLLLKKIEDKL